MKNGIVKENGRLIYYSNGVPNHAGAIKIDGDIYYVGRNGYLATGQHIVHGDMTNGILKRGTYTFSEDGKLIEGSYHAPKKVTRKSTHSTNKKDKHLNRKFRLKKRRLFLLISVCLAAVVLIFLAFNADKLSNKSGSESKAQKSDTYTLPNFKSPVNLCTTPAQKLYKNQISMEDIKPADFYQPLKFSYKLTDTDGELIISEEKDLSNSRKYVLSRYDKSVSIHNLKTGTTYYYQVNIGEDTYTGSLETAEGTRYISIPGIYNTRDIGGYTTANGKKIKQGMIIRGTEMDGLFDSAYFLSQSDVKAVQEQFGFVYDMDLRENRESYVNYTSPLGEDVGHKFYHAPAYVNAFSDPYKSTMKEIFSDLANPKNYPMYLHDTNGADRTGTVVYLLQGLLGMSDEDIMREYQMSALHRSDIVSLDRIEPVAEIISSYEGSTTAEKIENFLINDIGLTTEQINSIRNILLED